LAADAAAGDGVGAAGEWVGAAIRSSITVTFITAILTGAAATIAHIALVIRRTDVLLIIVRRAAPLAAGRQVIVRLRVAAGLPMAADHQAAVAHRILQAEVVRRITQASPIRENPEAVVRRAVETQAVVVRQETEIQEAGDRRVVAIPVAESRPQFSRSPAPSRVSRVTVPDRVNPVMDRSQASRAAVVRRFSRRRDRSQARSRIAATQRPPSRLAPRFSPRPSRVPCRPVDARRARAATRA